MQQQSTTQTALHESLFTDSATFHLKKEEYLIRIKGLLGTLSSSYACFDQIAEEVFQETVIQIYLFIHSGKYSEQNKFDTLFMSIAYKMICSNYRKWRKKHLSFSDFTTEDNTNAIETLLGIEEDYAICNRHKQEATEAVLDAVSQSISTQLEQRERAIMQSHYFEGLQVKEIANYLGLSEPNVKVILMRTRKKLKKKLPKTIQDQYYSLVA